MFGGGRQQLRRVPAADADRVGLHAPAGGELVDGVVAVGGAHAVEADLGPSAGHVGCLRFAVEDHQPVLGLAVAAVFFLVGLVVLEAPTQAFGGQQAGEEFQIALAVLGANGAWRQRLRDVEFKAQLRIVGQQFGDDVLCVLVLENIAVAAQPQQRQRRFQTQAVARGAAVGAEPRGLGADAVPGAPAAVGHQHGDGQFLADEQAEIEIGRHAERIDVEGIQLIDSFPPGEPFGHQRLGQRGLLRAGQREQARVLTQAGAEDPSAELSCDWMSIKAG